MTQATVTQTQIAIIGTGFAGLGMGIRLKRRGTEDFLLLDRAQEVGGTWRDSTYPDCACDVKSDLSSFPFAPNPDWSHRYARQPEILAYLRGKRVAVIGTGASAVQFSPEVQKVARQLTVFQRTPP